MDNEEDVTDSGIILTAGRSEQKTASLGTVYEVQEDNDLGLKKGDRVLFSRYSAEDVSIKISTTESIELKSVFIDAISAILDE